MENAATLNGDASRVAVGGDSAGGNLAAVVALMARDRKGPALAYQLLIYPATDYHTPGTPSYVENADGYFLTRDSMIWFWNYYILDEETAKHPLKMRLSGFLQSYLKVAQSLCRSWSIHLVKSLPGSQISTAFPGN